MTAPHHPSSSGAQLPTLLQPWAAWLSLFPEDLAATLGQLLLRLQPLVGPLRRHAARTAVDPAGVGDIVRRGAYEHLLISEWAIADAAPDEFLRRAGNGELLFTGPEPANSETSLHSIALFDAGPAQLGEARLAHLVLLILLARRAEQAGAQFRWGILQRPGVLYEPEGAESVRRLLAARTYEVPAEDGLAQWNTLLEDAAADCWLVGDRASPCPAPAHSRVFVERSWFARELEVEVVARRRSSSVALPLPTEQDGVRLLRRPFAPLTGAATMVAQALHSLKRAPMFGNAREWLAVAMVDGRITVYGVPHSERAGSGRPRLQKKPAHADSIIAAGVVGRSFGTLAVADGALHFAGFPGPIFQKLTQPLPDPGDFRAIPGALRWAPAFFWGSKAGGGSVEEVLVLDKDGNLVRWDCRRAAGHPASHTGFLLVSRDVIGAVQHGEHILFAVAGQGRSDVYTVSRGQPVRKHIHPIMHEGRQILFGEPKDWRAGRGGTYALRLDATAWLVADPDGTGRVVVPERDTVLGCARSPQSKRPALLVMNGARTRISLQDGEVNLPLLDSSEPIAHASFDPTYGRLAWLGGKSGALTVRAIDAQVPLLRVVQSRGTHDG